MTKKKKFQKIPAKFDFVENERQILDWWYKNKVVEKYLHKNDQSEKRFSFLDGPITANNPMGVHHAWGRTLKDVYQRYKNMQGFKQRFQNGFDCQGLWVEVEVERAMDFNSKKDIENHGIGKFTNACKARVEEYAQKQTEQSKRLGYFMDWDNSYYTMSETNNLYIWKFLKKCQQKGLIYKGKSATTWCPRCETGLSQHEQADGYKTITDTSVYLKFPIKDRKNKYFLVWTTTPWTLSANILLTINPEYEYVKAKLKDESLVYLAKESAKRLKLEIVETIPPKRLLGLEYITPYKDLPIQKNIKHKVVEWDLVSPEEGTGIVHVAPGCGEEDFELGQELGAPNPSPLDESGRFKDGYDGLTNKYAHEVGPEVIEFLKSQNLLYKTESISHSYPHCWRCGTKCLFRLEDNWFINCIKIKPKLKENAKKARWIPEYVGKRMQDWLNNMGDWMISRQRFYGLSLPFYECQKCKKLIVAGSKEELKKLAVNPEKVDKLPSLHRPWIDKVKIKCPHCQETVERIPDVGDCWLDAGVIPFSTLKYFEDKEYWKKWFPAKLVSEMIEQVRLWYYSMLVYGTIFEDKIPYENVLNYNEVRDEKGERMSKTKRNGIPFDEAAEKMGIDTIRWLYIRHKPELNLNFGYSIADEVRRQYIFLLWNSYRFFATYANLNEWYPSESPKSEIRNPKVLDSWILSRLENTKKEAESQLDNYHHHLAIRKMELFLNDFSTWYIRRSRQRVRPESENKDDINQTLSVLYYCLKQSCLVLAPFIPYLTETIWQGLQGRFNDWEEDNSIHLQDWPEVKEKAINEGLEGKMAVVREIVGQGHAIRKEKGIRVRQPLSKLKAEGPMLKAEELKDLIKQELNVKEVEIEEGKGDLKVELDTQITPNLEAEGQARDLIRDIQRARRKAGLNLNDEVVVYAPDWPKKFEEKILAATNAKEIKPAEELKVEKI